MSDENWIIPIPEDKSKEIAKLSKENKDQVFIVETETLKGIPDFPEAFVDDKIEAVAFSTSAIGDTDDFTVCMTVFRNDKGNVDLDPVGLMLMDLSDTTTSAGYIRHGDWHQNRTMDANSAKAFIDKIKGKKKSLKTSPEVLMSAHKRMNSFLTNTRKQQNANFSKQFRKKR